MTGEITSQRNRLVDQDLLQHGSIHAQGSGRERATVLRQQRGRQLGRERVRVA
jgi:hypothetical protein